jgi:hypothetical protein
LTVEVKWVFLYVYYFTDYVGLLAMAVNKMAVIANIRSYHTCIMKEAIEINIHPHKFNHLDSYRISKVWLHASPNHQPDWRLNFIIHITKLSHHHFSLK